MKTCFILLLVVLATATCSVIELESLLDEKTKQEINFKKQIDSLFKDKTWQEETVKKHLPTFIQEAQKQTTLPIQDNYKLVFTKLENYYKPSEAQHYDVFLYLGIQDENKVTYLGYISIHYFVADKSSTYELSKVENWDLSLSSDKDLPLEVNIDQPLGPSASFGVNFTKEIYRRATLNNLVKQITNNVTQNQKLKSFYQDVKISHARFQLLNFQMHLIPREGKSMAERRMERTGDVIMQVTATYKGEEHVYDVLYKGANLTDITTNSVRPGTITPRDTKICSVLRDFGYTQAVKEAQEGGQLPAGEFAHKKTTCVVTDEGHNFVFPYQREYTLVSTLESSDKTQYEVTFDATFDLVSGEIKPFAGLEGIKKVAASQ